MHQLMAVLLPGHGIAYHSVPVAKTSERPVYAHDSMQLLGARSHVVCECLEEDGQGTEPESH